MSQALQDCLTSHQRLKLCSLSKTQEQLFYRLAAATSSARMQISPCPAAKRQLVPADHCSSRTLHSASEHLSPPMLRMLHPWGHSVWASWGTAAGSWAGSEPDITLLLHTSVQSHLQTQNLAQNKCKLQLAPNTIYSLQWEKIIFTVCHAEVSAELCDSVQRLPGGCCGDWALLMRAFPHSSTSRTDW